jgi:hypothetical protein
VVDLAAKVHPQAEFGEHGGLHQRRLVGSCSVRGVSDVDVVGLVPSHQLVAANEGYRWYDEHNATPLFPFGYGLSYNTFAYSGLQVRHARDGGLDVAFRVRNTGHTTGSDVPQVYLGAPGKQPAGVQFAVQSLVGFTRVTLAPATRRMSPCTWHRANCPTGQPRLSNGYEPAAGAPSPAARLGDWLHDTDYQVLLGVGGNTEDSEARVVEAMIDRRMDGLVLIAPLASRADLERIATLAPTVIVGRHGRSPAFDVVADDDYTGAGLVVGHPADLGHRRIAHIDHRETDPDRLAEMPNAIRAEGYRQAMRARGLADQIDVVITSYTRDGGYLGAKQLLGRRHRPTAIFAGADFVAMGVFDAVAEAGLTIPDDISVAGYDNTTFAAFSPISLTSVDQAGRQMGAEQHWPSFRPGQAPGPASDNRVAVRRTCRYQASPQGAGPDRVQLSRRSWPAGRRRRCGGRGSPAGTTAGPGSSCPPSS